MLFTIILDRNVYQVLEIRNIFGKSNIKLKLFEKLNVTFKQRSERDKEKKSGMKNLSLSPYIFRTSVRREGNWKN